MTSDPVTNEVGVKFEASQAGFITALQYYRHTDDSGDTDTRTLNLWTGSGQLLGSVSVTSTLGQSGWQVGILTAPITIDADTIYVVSFGTNDNYSYIHNYFDIAHSSSDGLLTAPASGDVGGNEVYTFDTPAPGDGAGFFPTNNFMASNYLVDVYFQVDLGPNADPVITGGDAVTVHVNENVTTVTTVVATDTPGQIISYSIAGGEDQGLFTINTSTGVLSFLTAPDYEALPAPGDTPGYQVTVRADDGHGGIDTQDITVFVDDVDEPPPGTGFDGAALRVDYVFGNLAGVPAGFAGSTQFVTASAAPNTLDVTDLPDAEAIGNGPYGLATIDFGTDTIRIEYPLDAGVFDDGVVNFAAANSQPYNGVLITDSSGALPAIIGVTIVDQAGFTIPLGAGNLTFTSDTIFINVNDLSGGTPPTNSRATDVDPLTGGRQPSYYVLHVDFNDAPEITSNGSGATATTSIDENSTLVTILAATDAEFGPGANFLNSQWRRRRPVRDPERRRASFQSSAQC